MHRVKQRETGTVYACKRVVSESIRAQYLKTEVHTREWARVRECAHVRACVRGCVRARDDDVQRAQYYPDTRRCPYSRSAATRTSS